MVDLRPQGSPLALALGEWAVRWQLRATSGAHRDTLLDLRTGEFRTSLHALVPSVSPDLALAAAQQPVRLGYVGGVRRGRAQAALGIL